MNSKTAKLGPALSGILGSLLYPQVILTMFLPFFVSIVVVLLGLWFSREFWLSYFTSGPLALQPYWIWILERSPEWLHPLLNFVSAVAPWLLFIVLIALSYPLVVVLNLVFVSILVSTYLVKFIARRDFKGLELKGRARFTEGVLNTLSSSGLFLGIWFLTLPLWLIPGVGLVLPFLLTTWLNRRICTFDALTDFATDEEMSTLTQQTSSSGYLLGLITAALNYIPFAFFVSPVLTMVGFTYLNLQALQLKRQDQP
jgi:CysZ protein